MPPEKMATPTPAPPAALGWRAEAELLPPTRPRAPRFGFRTQAVPGELRPEQTDAGWSFNLGAAPDWNVAAELIAQGFHLGSAHSADEAWLVAGPGGVLFGEARGRFQPALFAPAVTAQQDGDLTWVADPGVSACLVVRPLADGRTRFALVVGEPTREPAEMRARQGLRNEPVALWEAAWSLRQVALRALGDLTGTAPTAEQGDDVETCGRALHPADTHSATRWLARLDDPRRQDVDATLPFVLAWRDIDRAVARDILVAAVATAQDEGWLPAHTRIDVPGGDLHLAWPAFALAARALGEPASATPDLVTALQRHLHWWAAHWRDAASSGPAAAPGFDPSLPALRPPALAALLLAEAAAWRAWVSIGQPQLADDSALRAAMQEWRCAIDAAPEDTPWTPAERACLALADSAPAATDDAVVNERTALPRALWLLAGRTPPLATETRSASCAGSAANLACVFVAARGGRDQAAVRGFAGWLDRHRALAWALAAAVVLAFLALVVASTLTRDTLTASSVETQAGLAARLYAEGRYDEAIALYEQIQRKGSHLMQVWGQIGNAHFRAGRFAEAAAAYERAVTALPQAPDPALNLALALHRLGQDEQAIAHYEAFQKRFGEAFPDLAQRAHLAADILREQRALQ